jgi:hypothetical protein
MTDDNLDFDDELIINVRSIAAEYDRLLNQMFYTFDDLISMFKLVMTPSLPYIENGKFSTSIATYPQLNALKLQYMEYDRARKEGRLTSNPLANESTVADLKIMLNMARNYYARTLPGALSSIVLKRSSDTMAEPFRYKSNAFFLDWAGDYISKPPDFGGRIGVVLGTQGSGKTNFVLVIDEKALEEGISVISNIQLLQEYPEQYHYVARTSDMYIKAVENAMRNIPSIGNIDEALLAGISKSEATTVELKDLDKSIRILRKIMLSPIYIMHENRSVASAMQESIGIMFQKHGNTANRSGRQSSDIVRYTQDKKPHYSTLTGIPKTQFSFNSRQLANYTDDISISTVYNDLTQYEEENHDPNSQFRYLIQLLIEYQEFYKKTHTKAYHGDKKSMLNFRAFQAARHSEQRVADTEEAAESSEIPDDA